MIISRTAFQQPVGFDNISTLKYKLAVNLTTHSIDKRSRKFYVLSFVDLQMALMHEGNTYLHVEARASVVKHTNVSTDAPTGTAICRSPCFTKVFKLRRTS